MLFLQLKLTRVKLINEVLTIKQLKIQKKNSIKYKKIELHPSGIYSGILKNYEANVGVFRPKKVVQLKLMLLLENLVNTITQRKYF